MSSESEWLNSAILKAVKGEIIEEVLVVRILRILQEILQRESNIATLQSPIVVVGGICGQLDDVLEMFIAAGEFEKDNEASITDRLRNKYVFLGDYIGQGHLSVNTFLLVASLKIKYPDRITLLRGSHEFREYTQSYGLYEEIIKKYGHNELFFIFNNTFDFLLISALIDNEIFCVHGGISPMYPLIDQISMIKRNVECEAFSGLADLIYGYPSTCENWANSRRSGGFYFGKKNVNKFIQLNGLKLICRSYMTNENGFEYFYGQKDESGNISDGLVLSIFSAPNNNKSGNKASIIKYNYNECLSDQKGIELIQFQARPLEDRIKL